MSRISTYGNTSRGSQAARRTRNSRACQRESVIERVSPRNRLLESSTHQLEDVNQTHNQQERLRRREVHNQQQRSRRKEVRARQSDEVRSQYAIIRRQQRQHLSFVNFERAGFRYDPNIQYSASVQIGQMSVVCQYFNAVKFKNEPLPELLPPPQPLFQLLYGESPHSSHFLKQIVNEQNYNPTFKVFLPNNIRQKLQSFPPIIHVHGQMFHLAGSLLPHPDQEHKYLQIYFLGDSHDEVNRRCAIFNTTKREIIEQLQQMLHEHNGLIKLFTISLERMPTDGHSIIIQAGKRPTGSHERQYNAPTDSEISVVVVGENLQSRDIVIKRRNQNALKRISETHRSYDAMQYRLMFCRREDGYHLGYKMINPVNG
ncbi:uncharacterized protein LOC125775391 isoform X2 [Bactrocera dorsalis]|uniref:Uncharacterized protein LOC125775391 isoform X2 n=1 Tax=Bactrocera dorsalis TaxID=27457 RepID=A0ABM3IY15_BACDO|nr:uncharacterized protein LOC125775391 isoform X2 [Bactrocera dorsalis]